MPGWGQRQQALTPVDRRGCARKQPIALNPLEDAAEVTRIEIQFAAEFSGRNPGALGKLVQHPRLGQREAAVQETVVQGADHARVEAAKSPDGGDAVVEGCGLSHDAVIRLIDWVKQQNSMMDERLSMRCDACQEPPAPFAPHSPPIS